MFVYSITILALLQAVVGSSLKFPKGFKFGAATSAYQIEGAWNVSGKSPSIWDTFVHKHPDRIHDKNNGDVACDSYRLWEEDIKAANETGLHFYRFSISWPRLLPSGFDNNISKDGAKFYNNLIDGLLENGIEPVVTLYHWDLPQTLQDLGGWTNPLISSWFADYARVAYSLYGDRVKTWITINEAVVVCYLGYGEGILAPGVRSPKIGNYLCNKHILLAHAKAWRIYDQVYKPKHGGKVSIANHYIWYEGHTPKDERLAETVRQYVYGIYNHPIFSKEGGWPPEIELQVAENSKKEGFLQSRMPAFTEEEKALVKGTFDFIGVNQYTSRTVAQNDGKKDTLTLLLLGAAMEFPVTTRARAEWQTASSSWLMINPSGLRNILNWIRKNYGDVEIIVTENGYSASDKTLEDVERIQYYKLYLEQLLLAVKDGVKVTGYTAWSLIDNFEWLEGYISNFGLYAVDFSSPKRTRMARNSAQFYAEIIKTNSLRTGKDEL